MRKSLIVLALLAILAASLFTVFDGGARPAQAGGSWSAWIYNNDTGTLVHVFPDGAAPTSFVIPRPPGFSNPPGMLTISRDGAYLAMCLVDDANNTQVSVYDIYHNAYLATHIAGVVQGCGLTRFSFSPDNNLLAFGLLNYFPGMADPRPQWELDVMEIHSGALVHQITASTPSITALGGDYSGSVPFVAAFDPGVIAFYPVRWATEGACEYDSLIWQLDGTNFVSKGGPYGKSGLDLLLPNSEAIWTEIDHNLPTGTLMGPGCENNIVMYSNKQGDRYPLFTNGAVLNLARFIDDGRKIAVNFLSGESWQWVAIDRSGGVSGLPADLQDVYQLWGTLDGYVFMTNNFVSGSTISQVRYHRFSGGPVPDAYVAWTGAPGENWRLVWVNPLSGGAGLPPFPPMSTVGTPPLPTPAPAGSLSIGGHARVQTTAGDFLRVRTGPGTGFPIFFQLANGSLVTLIGGPQSADGLTWWRIQSDRGTGWAVEGVMDNGTYLQTLVPAP